jgi:hypothetical protein
MAAGAKSEPARGEEMKYNITFSCGHKGVVDLVGSGKERERKLDWYQTSGMCPECYKEQKRAEEAAKPLTLTVKCDPYNQTIVLVWSGNTMPVKDQIKELGYQWGAPPSAGWLGILAMHAESFAWHKFVALEELDAALKAAGALEPQIVNNVTDADIIAYREVAAKRAEKQSKIDAIAKPICPNVLKGHKWNGNIYGRSGNYTIYPDGIKTSITDAEVKEIEAYVIAKGAYKKAIAEIQ